MPAVIHRLWQSPYLATGPVYLDSSVVVAWLVSRDPHHGRAIHFAGDHLVAGVELQVSLLGLDETMSAVFRGLVAQALHQSPASIKLHQLIKRHGPSIVQPYIPAMRAAMNYVLGWATLVDVRGTDGSTVLDSWLDRLPEIGGLHDAWHLAILEESGAKSLATADADFLRLKSLPHHLTVYRI